MLFLFKSISRYRSDYFLDPLLKRLGIKGTFNDKPIASFVKHELALRLYCTRRTFYNRLDMNPIRKIVEITFITVRSFEKFWKLRKSYDKSERKQYVRRLHIEPTLLLDAWAA